MDHSHDAHMGHLGGLAGLPPVAAAALTGLALTALLPGALLLVRRSPLWERVSLPAPVATTALVLAHAWAMLGGDAGLTPPGGAAVTEPVLLACAVLFWLPVVGRTRHRLGDTGRCLYLFLSAPLIDLPAIGVIALGRSAEGIAMIAGMLPLGLAALGTTWSWINREERISEQERIAEEERLTEQEPTGERQPAGERKRVNGEARAGSSDPLQVTGGGGTHAG